ncbi:transglutaminase-like cysteine peptidase [Sphingomicrobium aestuariivivum]|uniref:transglutaminase-like cysteine peptidase n=1 Tax=Sphingomicrobium aestuariivivum TaxID=1582356 RepID=UPI001FD6D885|nr:transglutaminase-like cysteine peptidase [Sphingomicrobium aestuariivivum]MCJ8191429.1 transglutaminase-like cysteine peptidase [Sphingomicrobium aestuariivivum]
MIKRASLLALPAMLALAGASPALAASAAASAGTDRNAPPPRLAIAAAQPVSSPAAASAIIGAPSALAALQARQSGTPLMMASALMAAKPTFEGFAPAHRAAPMLRTAHASRPDVFGSTALSVSKTAFDARFANVFARRSLGRAADVARRFAAADRMDALLGINAYVNRAVTFTDDRAATGRADRWNAAAETLRSGRGDCEDYAIAKMQMLRAAGFAADDLYLVVLKDLVRRADHAVLVVRHEGRFLVLDNSTDRLLDSDAVRDYKPVFSYSAGKAWIHGYKRETAPRPTRIAPVQLAAYTAN